MPTLHLTNRTTTNLSIVGTAGKPSVVVKDSPVEVDFSDIDKNELFCSTLLSLVNASKLYVRLNSATGHLLSADEVTALKDGSFVVDVDEDGIVDSSEGAVRAIISGINLKLTVPVYSVTLPGSGTGRFRPQRYYFLCTAANTLTADATLRLGTTSGGTQLLNDITMTNLDVANEVYRLDVAGTTAATIADNATLYAKIASAATGTSGTIKLIIEGVIL